MLIVDKFGRIQHPSVVLHISPNIERGEMSVVHGIIVHQTSSPTAQSTLNGYKIVGANGAHLLIDKDGTVYQTASLHQKTYHVGQIKSRCIATKTCTPADLIGLKNKKPGKEIGRIESKKPYPLRYPTNSDSIGIEIVSMYTNGVYEQLTDKQQASFNWLLNELEQTLKLNRADVFRHPEVSWKMDTEGASAQY